MTYQISILRRAQKELSKFSVDIYRRLCDGIQKLATDPRPAACKKLKDREGWRTRVGDYRVIYTIDDEELTIVILHVGHRRDVYR